MRSNIEFTDLIQSHKCKKARYRQFISVFIVFMKIDAIFMELYPMGLSGNTIAYLMICMRIFDLKKLSITAFICCAAFISKAQIGYDYAQYDIGFGAAMNKVYGDAQTIKTTPSIHFNFNYNQTPYLNYILEVEAGKLEGGNALKDTTGRQFSNSFTAVDFRVQVQAGELIDYSRSPFANALKNLYISTGIGMVVNDLTTNRYSYLIPNYYTPGEDHSEEIFIPARIGYEFKIYNQYQEPSVKIDFGYQVNFIMGDELDGFEAGKSNDKYSEIVVGVKFALGSVTSYRKQLFY